MKRLYAAKLIVLIALICGWNLNALAQTSTYSYSGSIQTYSVGAGVTSIGILCTGATGGNSSGYNGGHGASMYGVFTVVPGHVL